MQQDFYRGNGTFFSTAHQNSMTKDCKANVVGILKSKLKIRDASQQYLILWHSLSNRYRTVARNFRWGDLRLGGGGREGGEVHGSRTATKIINVVKMICHTSFEVTRDLEV